jgi:glucokinase
VLEAKEFLVLDFIREHGPTTRLQVGAALGLSGPTVSRIVGRLIRSDAVHEGGFAENRPGRPSRLLSYNSRVGSVVALDVGGTKIHGALADLAGDLIHEDLRPTRASGDAYRTLVDAASRLVRHASDRGLPVCALAVGVPALVDPVSDRVVEAPNVGWRELDLRSQLVSDLGVPCVVENDVNLAALAQAWRGDGPSLGCFVTLSIGTGIGAGVVVDGRVLRGRLGAAGEIGYLLLDRTQLRTPMVDRLGAFERVASGPAIAERARLLLKGRRPRQPTRHEARTLTPEAVLVRARDGDDLSLRVVEELLDDLAIAITAITVLLSPECIILDGGVGRALGPWIASLNERIAPHVLVAPVLTVSKLGEKATVVGAVAAALELVRQRSAPGSPIGAALHRGLSPLSLREPPALRSRQAG